MAFENIGLGGILTFNSAPAVRGMTKASRSFQRLELRARRLKEGMRRVGAGMRTLGMASVVGGVAMGFGLKKAVDFEHQMGAVASVTRATGKQLNTYSDFARKMGIETAFSASEAGKAMFVLGKFGLTKKPLMEATKGVTDLAAAEGIDLAAASRVMVGSLKSMSMSVMESKRAANVLALASASTEANVINLGESFAYAGSTAKQMNMSYEMTTAIFSALAGKMMVGSRAGTGVMALMRGLQGSSSRASKIMASLGINVQQFGGDMSRLPAIIEHIDQVLSKKFTNPIQKAQKITQIFGRFGQVAFSNLAQTGRKEMERIHQSLTKAGSAFKDKFGRPLGAAAWMAQKRLNTVKGAVILFKSSLESFFITIFQGFLGPMKSRIQDITKRFNNVLFAMQALEKDDSIKNQTALVKKYGHTTMQMALGFRDATKMVKNAWKAIGQAIQRVGRLFGKHIGKDTLRHVIKFTLGISMMLASLAPIFIALFGLKVLFGALWSVGTGMLIAIKAALLPVAVVLGGILALLMIRRKEGESLGQTALRMIMAIRSAAISLMNTVIVPLFEGIMDVMRAFTVEIADFWQGVAFQLQNLIYQTIGAFKKAISIIITIMRPLLSLVKGIILRLRPVFQALVKFAMVVYGVFVKVATAILAVFKAFARVVASIIRALKPILLDIVTAVGKVARWVMKVIAGLFKALGAVARGVMYLFRKLHQFMRPVVEAFGKIVQFLWIIGKIIFKVLVLPLKLVLGVVKDIGMWVWDKIAPGFRAIGRALGVFVNMIVRAGKLLKTVLLWPFQKIAQGLAYVLRKLAKVASIIPGVSGKAIREIATSLEHFSGVYSKGVGKRIAGGQRAQMKKQEMLTGGEARALAEEERRSARTQAKAEKTLNATIVDKRSLSVKAMSSIDGRCVASASARHRVELQERAGFGTTPWQRRAVILRSGDLTPAGKGK
jgi:TP901 family phage tail tape measure protein